MTSNNRLGERQEQLLQIGLDAASLDLDAFIEEAEQIGSPQALTAGLDLRLVKNAAEWTDIARLLKPFRDEVVRRLERITSEDETQP